MGFVLLNIPLREVCKFIASMAKPHVDIWPVLQHIKMKIILSCNVLFQISFARIYLTFAVFDSIS